MTYKVGLVGVRRGSSLVRPFEIFPETEITALCDMNQASLETAGKDFGIADSGLFTSYEDMLNSGIDIVVVGTPIPFHADQSVQALESGIHVLSEVTAANSMPDLERIVAAAQQSDAVYMLAENCCYRPYILEWKQWVQQGRLGEIFYAECEYIHNIEALLTNEATGEAYWRLQRPPITYCTHSLGPVLQIMDDRITQVSCVSTGNLITGNAAPGCRDMEVAICKTEKGGAIKLLRSQVARREPALHYYSFYGTKGFVEHDHSHAHGDTTGRLYIEGEHAAADGFEVIDCLLVDPNAPEEAKTGGHGTSEYFMVRDFIDAVANGTPAPIDAIRAAEMTAPGLCAHESSLNDGAWVDVPSFA
jgi:predicted dehydrogenase